MKVTVSFDVSLYSMVDIYRITCCIRLQGRTERLTAL